MGNNNWLSKAIQWKKRQRQKLVETEISGGSDWAEKDVGSFRTCIEQQQRHTNVLHEWNVCLQEAKKLSLQDCKLVGLKLTFAHLVTFLSFHTAI